MRYVFTDIDGVLNPNFSKKWSKKSIAVYNHICKEFNLLPVITSTWRINHTIDELQKIFTDQGIDVKIYDYTPHMDQQYRYLEILKWLESNPCEFYIVLDDRAHELNGYVDNFVKCRSWMGLTEDEYKEIKNIINSYESGN